MLGKPLRPESTLIEAKITDTSKIIAVVNVNIVSCHDIQQKTAPKPVNTPSSPVVPTQIPKTPTTPNITPMSSPPIQQVPKLVKTDSIPEKSQDDSDIEYAKRQLSSPSILPLLKECSHFPSKSQLFLSVFEKQDPRLFGVYFVFSISQILLKNPDLLVEAIVKIADEPDVPEVPIQPTPFNRPQQTIQLSQEDVSNIQMVDSALISLIVVGESGLFKRRVCCGLFGL